MQRGWRVAGVDVCVGAWSCVDKDVHMRGVVGVFFIGWEGLLSLWCPGAGAETCRK